MQRIWGLGGLANTGSRKDRGTNAAVCPVRGGLPPSPALVAAWAWTQNTLRFCKTNQFPGDGGALLPFQSKGGQPGLVELLPDPVTAPPRPPPLSLPSSVSM